MNSNLTRDGREDKSIYIGEYIDEWEKLRAEIGCNDKDLVKILLKCFFRYGKLMDDEDNDLKMNYENTSVKFETFVTNSEHSISNEISTSTPSTETSVDAGSVKCELDLDVITSMYGNLENESENNTVIPPESDHTYSMNYQNINIVSMPCNVGNSDRMINKRISARLLAKGFRPNYASLAKWKTDESDNTSEDSDADSDFTDFDFDIVVENIETKENQNSSDVDNGKRKRDGEDEFVDKTHDKKKSLTCKKIKSEITTSKMRKKENRKQVLVSSNDVKVTKDKHVKIKGNTLWSSIKLEDHSEKYRIEKFGSFDRKNRGNNIVKELYTCLLCGKFKINNRPIFEKHLEKHLNGLFDCSLCKFVARTENELSLHRRRDHQTLYNEPEFVCHICGVVMYGDENRKYHMGKEHNDPQFKCKHCDMNFASKNCRQQHCRNVHGDLEQFCNICRKSFRSYTMDEYIAHKSTCKPGHQCPVCGKMFVSKGGLNRHISSIHMNERKHQCNMCPYSALRSQRLRTHILTHTNSHPYSCEKCTYTCVRADQLQVHQRTHTGEKPYKCTQCNYAAAWNVQLKDHIKVHSMNTSVLCEPCNILFKNEKAKTMHEKKDH